jgi:hypothetical protein
VKEKLQSSLQVKTHIYTLKKINPCSTGVIDVHRIVAGRARTCLLRSDHR